MHSAHWHSIIVLHLNHEKRKKKKKGQKNINWNKNNDKNFATAFFRYHWNVIEWSSAKKVLWNRKVTPYDALCKLRKERRNDERLHYDFDEIDALWLCKLMFHICDCISYSFFLNAIHLILSSFVQNSASEHTKKERTIDKRYVAQLIANSVKQIINPKQKNDEKRKCLKKTMANSFNWIKYYVGKKSNWKSAWNNINYFQRCEKLSQVIIQEKTHARTKRSYVYKHSHMHGSEEKRLFHARREYYGIHSIIRKPSAQIAFITM